MPHAYALHLAQLLPRAAALFSRRTAVLVPDLGVALTYEELHQRVWRLARGLRGRGLERGDRVAVLDRNSLRHLEIQLAAAAADLVLLPLNTRLADAELASILARTGCRLLLAPESRTATARALAGSQGAVPLIDWADEAGPGSRNAYEALLESGSELPPRSTPEASDAVVQIFFTSGTTGAPKGVCLTSTNLLTSAFDSIAALGLSGDDVWLHAAPMFHLVDAFAIWTVTLVGGTHVIASFDPSTFPALIDRTGVTWTSLPPTLVDRICEAGPDSALLSSFRGITYGGAPMLGDARARASRSFPCPLVQAYGATEVSGLICQQRPRDLRTPPDAVGAVGPPTPAIRLRVLDDDGRPVAPGGVGEIVVAGPKVMAGYWQDPDATDQAIRNGWYHTGDLGYQRPDGSVCLVDRKKDMIITGGENVFSREVEQVLTSHEAVLEAAVIGVPSERWGEAVHAIVRLRPGAHVSPEALQAYCRRWIGGFKVPKSIDIADRPLPRTGPGKIAKHLLRAPFWKEPDR